ncbi:hypothetical protein EG68_06327 [Paragonimus skrjabini miyazakii]|uniref:Uncharacterized protein n=1 Tax=Paragonimus skrjabini miyazakii TaxID=59628 RepID=A0A8S9YAF7_9TREM|nr:hypothetical protein EG68_06327 [Paragonimus skrjabini miyazakii]
MAYLVFENADGLSAFCVSVQNAYKNWLCASEFPLYVSLDDSNFARSSQSPSVSDSTAVFDNFSYPDEFVPAFSSMIHKDSLLLSDRLINSSRKPLHRFRSYAPPSSERPPLSPASSSENFRLSVIPLCNSWCTQVETVCPYFNPQDSTSNGGEPAFLCHESHYHHSSQYRNVYESKEECEVNCCVSQADLYFLATSTSPDDPSVPQNVADTSPKYSSDDASEKGLKSCYHPLSGRCNHLSSKSPSEYTVLSSHTPPLPTLHTLFTSSESYVTSRSSPAFVHSIILPDRAPDSSLQS